MAQRIEENQLAALETAEFELESTQFPTAKAITILPPLPSKQPAMQLKIHIADSKNYTMEAK